MGFLGTIFGYPLGYVMWLIYSLVKNYGIAILIFTVVIRLVLFPLSVKQQKSTAAMSSLTPKLEKLKKQYANNQEKLNEETMKLYAEENVNPMASCLPTLIQFPFLFGIIDVVYRPITHILRINKDVLTKAKEIAITFFENDKSAFNARPELYIVRLFNDNPDAFAEIPELTDKLAHFKNTFLGLDLGLVPNIVFDAAQRASLPTSQVVALFIIPIISGIFQLGITIYSQYRMKKQNGSVAQSMGAMNIMMYGMPLFSIWIAYSFPAGIGLYWIISSLLGLVQSVILYNVYTPEYVATLVEKEKIKKNKKPNMMQMMYQQQLEQQKAQGKPVSAAAEIDLDKNPKDIKISKSKQKELESRIIAEARRRQAEKYGEEYQDTSN